MKKQTWMAATLAVVLAVFSSTAAMGQKKSDSEWMENFTSRITLLMEYNICYCTLIFNLPVFATHEHLIMSPHIKTATKYKRFCWLIEAQI